MYRSFGLAFCACLGLAGSVRADSITVTQVVRQVYSSISGSYMSAHADPPINIETSDQDFDFIETAGEWHGVAAASTAGHLPLPELDQVVTQDSTVTVTGHSLDVTFSGSAMDLTMADWSQEPQGIGWNTYGSVLTTLSVAFHVSVSSAYTFDIDGYGPITSPMGPYADVWLAGNDLLGSGVLAPGDYQLNVFLQSKILNGVHFNVTSPVPVPTAAWGGLALLGGLTAFRRSRASLA